MSEKKSKNFNTKKTIIFVVCFILLFVFTYFFIENKQTNTIYEKAKQAEIDGVQTLVLKNGVYIGNIDNKIINGEGKYMLDSGDFYEGEWKDDVPSGNGKMIIYNYGKYIGEFLDGKRNGEGTFYYEDGRIIEGKWENDKLIDEFKITFADKSFYEGKIDNENNFSYGLYTVVSEDGYCEFSIANGEIGEATFYFNNGDTCTGPIVNEKFNGKCNITYANGDKYIGDIVNNMKEGQGQYKFNNDDEDYLSGTWKNDQIVDGIYHYDTDTNLRGEFVNNKPNGECIITKKENLQKEVHYISKWVDGKCVSMVKNDD